MKRPLALFGVCYLLTQMLAVFLPPAALWLLAAFFTLFCGVLLWRKVIRCKAVWVAVCSIVLALLLRAGYHALVVQPLQQYIGHETFVTANVLEIGTGYAENLVQATFEITQINGEKLFKTFKATAQNVPEMQRGDVVEMSAVFASVPQNSYQYNAYADGIFVTIDAVMQCKVVGKYQSFFLLCNRLQQKLSDNIRSVLHYEIGKIASAMAVGDKMYLSTAIKNSFRSAGLSHALVVSGLHLGICSGAVFALARRRMRQKHAAVFGCLAVLLFVPIAGFSTSLIRAGVSMILLYIGLMFDRQSDAVTSLAASAVLLCTVNPYAAADIGLLFSYSATLGVLYAGYQTRIYVQSHPPMDGMQAVRQKILSAVCVSAAATLATLPIQIAIGGGISLLSVLCNVLALPLLSAIVMLGLMLSWLGGIGFLWPLAKFCGLLCGLCVKLLYTMALLAQKVPGAMVYISGFVAICTLVGVAILLWYGAEHGLRLRSNVALCALFLLLCGAGYGVLNANVVRIALVGSGQNPAVVLTQGLQTMVLFRGPRKNEEAVQKYLAQHNRNQVDWLIDLRTENETELLAETLYAENYFSVDNDVVRRVTKEPFRDIMVIAYHQSEGNYVCVSVDGYVFGVASGAIDASVSPPVQLYVAGSAQPKNLVCEQIWLPKAKLQWIETYGGAAERLHSTGESSVVLRKGKSVLLKEVVHDFTGS